MCEILMVFSSSKWALGFSQGIYMLSGICCNLHCLENYNLSLIAAFAVKGYIFSLFYDLFSAVRFNVETSTSLAK
jgi:hypothetical protein